MSPAGANLEMNSASNMERNSWPYQHLNVMDPNFYNRQNQVTSCPSNHWCSWVGYTRASRRNWFVVPALINDTYLRMYGVQASLGVVRIGSARCPDRHDLWDSSSAVQRLLTLRSWPLALNYIWFEQNILLSSKACRAASSVFTVSGKVKLPATREATDEIGLTCGFAGYSSDSLLMFVRHLSSQSGNATKSHLTTMQIPAQSPRDIRLCLEAASLSLPVSPAFDQGLLGAADQQIVKPGLNTWPGVHEMTLGMQAPNFTGKRCRVFLTKGWHTRHIIDLCKS